MKTSDKNNEILKILLTNNSEIHTVTSIANRIKLTRQGTFNALKKLETEKLVVLTPIGSEKTSTYIIRLNWENPLVEKILLMIIVKESIEHKRWKDSFLELEKDVKFSIIYGSILESAKDANDIDILCVVSTKNSFVNIEKTITKLQKTQIKKIHAISLTETELRTELKEKNNAFIEAIGRGVVLFGEEDFIKFIRGLKND